MVQVSREKRRDNRFYRGLVRYFKGGMLELPAGGGKHYMMPQFQVSELYSTVHLQLNIW